MSSHCLVMAFNKKTQVFSYTLKHLRWNQLWLSSIAREFWSVWCARPFNLKIHNCRSRIVHFLESIVNDVTNWIGGDIFLVFDRLKTFMTMLTMKPAFFTFAASPVKSQPEAWINYFVKNNIFHLKLMTQRTWLNDTTSVMCGHAVLGIRRNFLSAEHLLRRSFAKFSYELTPL